MGDDRRSKWYVGAAGSCGPHELYGLEQTGQYIQEQKYGGIFVSIEVLPGQALVATSATIYGRVLKGDKDGGIGRMALPCPGTVVVGALEVIHPAASDGRGTRKVHVTDILKAQGMSCAAWALGLRKEALAEWHNRLTAEQRESIALAPFWTSGFYERHRSIVSSGGEGTILKKKKSSAISGRKDGKLDGWLKCVEVQGDKSAG